MKDNNEMVAGVNRLRKRLYLEPVNLSDQVGYGLLEMIEQLLIRVEILEENDATRECL